jgi:hypothetical protein
MRGQNGSLAAVAIALTLVSGTADAGCPNTCDIAVASPILEPELVCASLNVSGHNCDCGVHLTVANQCPTEIEAVDFQFNSCYVSLLGSADEPVSDCTAIPEGHDAVLRLSTTGNGHKEWTFHLRNDGTDHTLLLTADVSDFDDSGYPWGCSHGAGGRRCLGVAAIGLLLGLIAWRRRRVWADPGT